EPALVDVKATVVLAVLDAVDDALRPEVRLKTLNVVARLDRAGDDEGWDVARPVEHRAADGRAGIGEGLIRVSRRRPAETGDDRQQQYSAHLHLTPPCENAVSSLRFEPYPEIRPQRQPTGDPVVEHSVRLRALSCQDAFDRPMFLTPCRERMIERATSGE